jgi:hypothetical protein
MVKNCPDCGFWKACDPCSNNYDLINEDIKSREYKASLAYQLKDASREVPRGELLEFKK